MSPLVLRGWRECQVREVWRPFCLSRGCCTLRSLTRTQSPAGWELLLIVCTPWSPDCDWYFLWTARTLTTLGDQSLENYFELDVRWGHWTDILCPLSSSPPVSPITKHSSPSHPQFPQFEVNIRMKINNQFYSYLLNRREKENYF